MTFGLENEAAIERFVSQVGYETDAAIAPYLDEIKTETEAIFTQADINLLMKEGEIYGGMEAPALYPFPGLMEERSLTETKLGMLDVRAVRKYEGLFKANFDELQHLVDSLKDEADIGIWAATSEQMKSHIAALNKILNVIGGRSVTGTKSVELYFTGDEEGPTDVHHNSFSNLQFQGSLTRVEAVNRPEQEEEGLYACLVVKPLETSPLSTVQSYAEELERKHPRAKMIKEETWIPIGNVLFVFDHIPAQPRIGKVA